MGKSGAILVTGASGFVGSHLVERLLEAGFAVRALVRPSSDVAHLAELGVERVVGTLDDLPALVQAVSGADAVLHLAAVTGARSQAEYDRVNRDGTRLLVQAMLTASPCPRRLVLLSSLAAVGPSADGRPVTAGNTPRPLTAYGRSKLAGEAETLALQGRAEVVVLRAPAVYGPRDRELLRFFRLARLGVLAVPGGPERYVQLIHVADLADALVRAVTAPGAAGIHHVADPQPYAWTQIVRWVGEAVGRRGIMIPVPGWMVRTAAVASEAAARLRGGATVFNREKVTELLAPAWLADTTSAERVLGFRTRISLREGLADTARWYRAHGWI